MSYGGSVATTTISATTVQLAEQLRVTLSRLRRRLREVHDSDELTPSQLSVLSRLDKDGPAWPSALAAAERVRPQSMAAILGVLEERGLVRRDPDPVDRRRHQVSLTAAARQWISGSRRMREEWLARTLHEHFTEPERRTIERALALLDRLTTA
jgi:DNA-binding MarR family transcriptional regulator